MHQIFKMTHFKINLDLIMIYFMLKYQYLQTNKYECDNNNLDYEIINFSTET